MISKTHKNIQIRYNYLVYILFAYLPFYLPIRIYYTNSIIYVQDIIVALLCVIFVYKNNQKQNIIDASMILFLIYSLILVFVISATKGGTPLIIKHMHTFVTGIFMYFIASNLLNKNDFHFLLNLYICTAMIVSVLYTYEWVTVNLFNYPIFAWTKEFYKDYGNFLDKGALGFVRPMGIIGYSHATGIFISGALGVVYSKYQQNFKFSFILIGILLLISILLTGSRTAILSTVILIFTSRIPGIKRQKFKGFFVIVIIFMVSVFTFRWLREYEALLSLYTMISSSFSNDASIIDIFSSVLFRDIELAKLMFSNYPFALFTGAGFPFYVYGKGQILNPIFSNDTYFIMWITQYGLFGFSLIFFCLLKVFKRIRQNLTFKLHQPDDRVIILSSYRIILIFLFSTIHSASIQFYPIYFSFFTFLGVANYMTSVSNFGEENTFYK